MGFLTQWAAVDGALKQLQVCIVPDDMREDIVQPGASWMGRSAAKSLIFGPEQEKRGFCAEKKSGLISCLAGHP
jgi:hypothetical protein